MISKVVSLELKSFLISTQFLRSHKPNKERALWRGNEKAKQCGQRKTLIDQPCTGKYLSEALILASTNPKYDKKLFIESRVQYTKTANSENKLFCFCIDN